MIPHIILNYWSNGIKFVRRPVHPAIAYNILETNTNGILLLNYVNTKLSVFEPFAMYKIFPNTNIITVSILELIIVPFLNSLSSYLFNVPF